MYICIYCIYIYRCVHTYIYIYIPCDPKTIISKSRPENKSRDSYLAFKQNCEITHAAMTVQTQVH